MNIATAYEAMITQYFILSVYSVNSISTFGQRVTLFTRDGNS